MYLKANTNLFYWSICLKLLPKTVFIGLVALDREIRMYVSREHSVCAVDSCVCVVCALVLRMNKLSVCIVHIPLCFT